MKKIFETNDKHEINSLKNYLNDQYYESEIKNTSVKYELFVHENIYDDVLVEIQQMNKKLSGTIVLDKNNSISKNNYKKGSYKFDNRRLYQKSRIGELSHFCNVSEKVQSMSDVCDTQTRRVFKRYHLYRLK